MNRSLLSLLVCPTCRSDKLRLEALLSRGDQIDDGWIVCAACAAWYRIEDGLADLLPMQQRDRERLERFANRYHVGGFGNVDAPTSVTGNFAAQQAFFARYHDAYEERVVNSPYYRALDKETFEVWVEACLKPDQLVLEVGCGSGHQTVALVQRGVRTVGVDVSEEMLRVAQDKVVALNKSGSADFVRASAESLPFSDGVFDAFIFYGTLHHVDDPQAAVQNANRTLAPDGHYYILEPNATPIRFLFDSLMRVWRLWEEEARDDRHFRGSQLMSWLAGTSSECAVRLSTFLPPHVWYVVRGRPGRWLLRMSDHVMGSIPVIRRLGGVLIVSGTKAPADITQAAG